MSTVSMISDALLRLKGLTDSLCAASKMSDALLRLEGLTDSLCAASKISDALLRLEGLTDSLCAASKISDALLRLEGVGHWQGRHVEGCRRGCATSASASGRQYRPASYSQAESKCVITN